MTGISRNRVAYAAAGILRLEHAFCVDGGDAGSSDNDCTRAVVCKRPPSHHKALRMFFFCLFVCLFVLRF